MTSIPVQMKTISMQTGECTEETMLQFLMMPAPDATCDMCGVDHNPRHPHDACSLIYQYAFYAEHGRWPTWQDAMAHCSRTVQAVWTIALKKRGVDVEAGQLLPPEGA